MEVADVLVLAAGGVFGALCWGMAAMVLAASPRRPLNRWLAAFFLLSGGLTATAVPMSFSRDLFLAYNATVWNLALFLPATVAYALFVGLAIRSPLVRPFAWRPLRVALAATALLAAAGIVALHARVFPTGGRDAGGTWHFPPRAEVVAPVLLAFVVISLLSLAGSVHAWRRAPPGSVERERAAAYVLAFGVQDVGYVVLNTLPALPGLASPRTSSIATAAGMVLLVVVLALLARGLLRHQLFDFDLKVKRGIARGTVAAAFVAVFFVASEGAQQLLSDRLGPLVGLIAAGLLVFALAPLQRMAERVADAAMPGVSASPEYVAYRKLHVYRATLEGAYVDGEVTPRERAMLDRLRKELGVREEDAAAVEAEVAAERSA